MDLYRCCMEFSNSSVKKIEDIELLHLYLNDNNSLALSTLFERYKPLIISRVSAFGLAQSEVDDAVQECMIVLYSAIYSYNSNKASFATYISVCINRALISYCRNNKKITAIPIDKINEDSSPFFGTSISNNPQNILESNFNYSELVNKVKSTLSKREFSVLQLMFLGLKYSEIANKLSINEKAVDNAVQRIRNKFTNMPE